MKQLNCASNVSTIIDYVGMDVAMNSLDFSGNLLYDDSIAAANVLVNLLANALVPNTKMVRLSMRTRTIRPWITIGLLRRIRTLNLNIA